MSDQRFARACIRAHSEGVLGSHSVVLAEDFHEMVCNGLIEFRRVSAEDFRVLPYKTTTDKPVWIYPRGSSDGDRYETEWWQTEQEEEWWENDLMMDWTTE